MGMIGVFLSESTIIKTGCATWVALSFIHGAINVLHSLRYNRQQQTPFVKNKTSLRDLVNENKLTAPKVLAYCEVLEPKLPIWKFWKRRKVIWREEKTFEYKHWIDLTEINDETIQHFEREQNIVTMIDFDVRIDDEETEKSYQRHVQNLLDELPEVCRNGEIKTKRLIRIGQVDVEKVVVKSKNLGLTECLRAWILINPVYILKLFQFQEMILQAWI